ncbi:putative serine protease PepD [Actinopolymorpha cephalotaxi]|uniref:Serine protease PepD n=1 Tax=Actinopolymorpha cephalotaxi TaxID=504797 RepID=A0ABX2RZ31_9ACTN|nr:putative serine protease PepD [Actinopolymorpha cephalotaxi]
MVVIAVLCGGVVGGAAGTFAAINIARDGHTAPTAGALGVSENSGLVPRLIARTNPSVVEIDTWFLGHRAVGTGVILTNDGLILTNFHVVSPARRIGVRFVPGQTPLSAVLVSAAPRADLAVIRVTTDGGLTPARLGDSDSLEVGQTVVAVGTSEGLHDSASLGIISALNRPVSVPEASTGLAPSGGVVTYDAIQTDAALNPGNSGGPLFDLDGRVIGINSAIYTPPDRAPVTGIGFAIPINTAKQIIHNLSTEGG